MKHYYRLTTLDPVILSQTRATTNNHECLDAIPGSAILGALAAKLYAQMPPEESWRAFHSGECRFGPCYPETEGQLCLPTPASWHHEKDLKPTGKVNQVRKYLPENLTNQAAAGFVQEEGKQYKQCREGYVGPHGQYPEVRQGLSTKTALDREKGKALDSNLFSYQFLEAGQTFAGWLECNDSPLATQLMNALAGEQRLGRSRNTEFGRVHIEWLPEVKEPDLEARANELVLWCLSEAEFLDHLGLPTLSPQANAIHPQLQGTLNRGRSFIRETRIARFNQKRGGSDSEQILVKQGSVLVFDLSQPASKEVLNQIERGGVGIGRQFGQGWVQVNPAWSRSALLGEGNWFTPLAVAGRPEKAPVTPTDSALVSWVQRKLTQGTTKAKAQSRVNDLLEAILQAYRNARRYNDARASEVAGPSSTQWRRLAELVREGKANWAALAFEGDGAICKAKNDEFGWGIEWHDREGLTNFASFAHTLFASEPVTTMRLLLEQLCRQDLSLNSELNWAENDLKRQVAHTTKKQPATETSKEH